MERPSHQHTTDAAADLQKPTHNEDEPGTTPRRRALQACETCHGRKVRCDVSESHPCGNCKWAKLECVPRKHRKRLRRRQHHITPVNLVDQLPSSPSPPISVENLVASSKSSFFGRTHALPQLLPHQKPHPSVIEDDVQFDLPPFIKPPAATISAEDAAFLRRRGAFSLPAPHLQDALLRAYLDCFYSYMPLLDIEELVLPALSRDGKYGQLSLLLYQSVLFTGASFVDLKILNELGYTSRQSARRALFARVRALYDFDWDDDRFVLIQALLMMSFFYDTREEQKDAWHWTGLAVSLAYEMGLHVEPPATLPTGIRRLRRRIWWSCVIRDRLVAVGLGRPLRIKSGDFEVSVLSAGDFNIDAVSDASCALSRRRSFPAELQHQRALAQLWVAKSQLCACLGSIIEAQYAWLTGLPAHEDDGSSESSMLMSKINLDMIESCDAKLLAWSQALPPSCQDQSSELGTADGERHLHAVRNLLHLGYYTAVLVLYSPLTTTSFGASSSEVDVLGLLQTAETRVRNAALHIARLVSELQAIELGKYLHTNGTAAFIPPLLLHLLEMTKDTSHLGGLTQTRHEQVEALRNICKMCSETGLTCGFFDAALLNVVDRMHTSIVKREEDDHIKTHLALIDSGDPKTDPFAQLFLEMSREADLGIYPGSAQENQEAVGDAYRDTNPAEPSNPSDIDPLFKSYGVTLDQMSSPSDQSTTFESLSKDMDWTSFSESDQEIQLLFDSTEDANNTATGGGQNDSE